MNKIRINFTVNIKPKNSRLTLINEIKINKIINVKLLI